MPRAREKSTAGWRHQGPMSCGRSKLAEALRRITEMSVRMRKGIPGKEQQEQSPERRTEQKNFLAVGMRPIRMI